MNNFIDYQNWRYATKKFDTTKKIDALDLEFLKESMRLSASSYGLQPYKIFIIENPEIRAKLLPAAYGQTQIIEASHLIVFANQTEVDAQYIEQYLKNISQTRSIPIETLNDYGAFMKGAIARQTPEQTQIWTSKQAYIALTNLLNAAPEREIDVTPMEGFDAAQFNQILDLTSQNLNAAVIAAIGYRHSEDNTQYYNKVRKPNHELFTTL